jgi:hypothetical protein
VTLRRLRQVVGKGGFGKVNAVQRKGQKNGPLLAMKRLEKAKVGAREGGSRSALC